MPYATCTIEELLLKHPNVFQTLHVFYSILFQDKVTVAQAYFSIIFWPHKLIFENVSLSIKEEIADETQNGSSNLHLEEDSNKVM